MTGDILRWILPCVALLNIAGAATAQTTLTEPEGEIQLRDALSLALVHNPHLATFGWGVRAAEAAQLQVGAWPNPEIGFEVENVAGSGVFEGTQSAEATLILSQLVRLGGKRGKLTEVARLDHQISNWDYETARIETYAATVSAFVGVLAAQEQVTLGDRIVEVAEGILEAVSARVRAGGTLALEENRARVALEGSLIEKHLAERRLTIARRELSAIWGSEAPQFTRAVGVLDAVADTTPALDSLIARVDDNPQVARWTTEFERRRARVDLIKASRVPDLNIVGGIRHDNAVDDVGFVFGIALPLPMWDRKGGAIREAEYLVSQTTDARRAVVTDIRREIAVTYEVLAGAYDEATRLRDRVLPEAEEAATNSEAAYRSGAIELTDVLDIQRTFYRLRVRYVGALARYHGAVAELESLMGAPLAEKGVLPESDEQREEE